MCPTTANSKRCMRVQCPHCGATGNIPDDKIPAQGTKIACPKCKSPFEIRKPGAAAPEKQEAPGYYERGVKLLKERQLDAAIEQFQLAIQHQPQMSEAYRSLGIAYGQKNLWPEAAQTLQQALTYIPQDATVLKNLGIAYLRQNKFAEAEPVLQQAVELSPQDEKIQSFLALARQKNAQQSSQPQAQSPAAPPAAPAKAPVAPDVTASQEPSSTQPNPIQKLLDQGVEYLENAQFTSAIEAFQEVCRIAPQRSDGYVGLAMVYERQGERAKAIEAYEKAIEINPNDQTTKETLKAMKKQKKSFRWQFWKK